MIKIKLIPGDVKTLNNAYFFLSKRELPHPGWKQVAMNLIELEDKVIKIDKVILQVATKLGYVEHGKLKLDTAEKNDHLNKELEEYMSNPKGVIMCNLIPLDEKSLEKLSFPPDLIKVLLKHKLIK